MGVEIELQLIDWKTHALCHAAPRVLARVGHREDVKAELFQSMLEITTGVCQTLAQVRTDLEAARAAVGEACESLGVMPASAGTHAFAVADDRIAFPADRYRYLLDRNQWIARQLFIFGLHVHLGMRSGDEAISMMNGLSGHLALLLALSASSPMLHGKDTGLASSRVTVFEAMPTAGTPPASFTDWREYEGFYDRLVKSGSIASPKDLWWDIRPNAAYGTLEVRICDAMPTLVETVGVVALLRCLVEWLGERSAAGEVLVATPAWRMRENKWRAARWGLEAQLVVSDDGRTAPLRGEAATMLERLSPYARRLECETELDAVRTILEAGGSYQRQRSVFAQAQSAGAVVHSVCEEWRTGVPRYGF